MVRQKRKAPDKKRPYIQALATFLSNADIGNYLKGTISSSPLKHGCAPGLNCYSCPGAIGACPLGSLQNALGTGRIPFYMAGFFLLTGVLLGRVVCGFLCPIGFLQELLYRIPTKKIRKTRKTKNLFRALSAVKFILLAFLVVALPVIIFLKDGISPPWFCKLVCPAGTVGAALPLLAVNPLVRSALGFLFSWKLSLSLIIFSLSIFIYRPFCRFLCPLGAIYSFFNRIAFIGIKLDKKKCTSCGACTAFCKMDTKEVNDLECIKCGECVKVCRYGALKRN